MSFFKRSNPFSDIVAAVLLGLLVFGLLLGNSITRSMLRMSIQQHKTFENFVMIYDLQIVPDNSEFFTKFPQGSLVAGHRTCTDVYAAVLRGEHKPRWYKREHTELLGPVIEVPQPQCTVNRLGGVK